MTDDLLESSFDASSTRAKVGLEFQEVALQELLFCGVIAKSVPEWLKKIDPELSNSQVWKLEKTWGDIVVKKRDGTKLFIECVTASHETTMFPLSKAENFCGNNKWYLFGWESERYFVPSAQWNAWVCKHEEVKIRKKDTVAIVRKKNYASMRCGISGVKKFCEENDLI